MENQPEQHSITPSVGQALKSARVERGLSLESIADKLRISKSSLTHLEENHDNLVCDVYTIGFLRSYAQFLGLDPDNLIQKFKNQATLPKASQLAFPAPLPGRGMPSFRILGLTLLALLVIIAGWEWFGYQETAPLLQEEPILIEAQLEEEPKNTPASSTEPAPLVQQNVSEISSLIDTEEPLKSLPPEEKVLLKVATTSWIEVKNENGEIILNRLFHPGETYEFKSPQDLVLKTGNAGGFSLISGEKILDSLGKTGEVKSEISLDPKKWLEQNPEIQ
jgi:cytoskeleton protein RodZ